MAPHLDHKRCVRYEFVGQTRGHARMESLRERCRATFRRRHRQTEFSYISRIRKLEEPSSFAAAADEGPKVHQATVGRVSYQDPLTSVNQPANSETREIATC